MKTAVDASFVGKDRACNRWFPQICGHYLVDPVPCTWAWGWEKGQVENQVGVVRRRFFVPRPKFKSYAELNAWLEDRCLDYAKANKYPELRDKSISEVFREERPSLVPYVGPFDGFHAVPASVSKTCLVRFDKNRYLGVAHQAFGAVVLAAALVVDGGIYRHDFVAQAVVSGLMEAGLKAGVPVLSVSLTPHNFQPTEEHMNFFMAHFVKKGQEAADAAMQMAALYEAQSRSADIAA